MVWLKLLEGTGLPEELRFRLELLRFELLFWSDASCVRQTMGAEAGCGNTKFIYTI